MKSLFFILLTFLTVSLNAQQTKKNIFYCGYGENAKNTNLCDYFQSNSFTTDKSAENAVDKILLPLGLPRNFVLVACPKIKNAVAVTSNQGVRYIVYDNDFMGTIDQYTSNWSSLSILAHEIGHHLCGHTLTASASLAEQRKRELEADEFSGFVLFKLGASLEQSEAALLNITNNNDDTYSTHPKQSLRLAAIEKGYNKSRTQVPIDNVDKSTSAEQYFYEALELRNRSLSKEAIEKYNKCIELNPNYANAYFNRGFAKKILKDYYGALADYNKAIEINPYDGDAYSNRGSIKILLQDNYGAIAEYNKAIEINPNEIKYSGRGAAKANLKDYNGAISDYNKAIDINPNVFYTYYNRGNAKKNIKDYYGALTDYNKAIEINPYSGDAYGNRGATKANLKDYYGAISDYNKAIEINPDEIKYSGRGAAKLDLKDYNGAISDYSKAIDIKPNVAYLYNNRGIAKNAQQDYYGALADYNKAIEINPYDAFPYYSRGMAKISLNSREDACLDFKKASEMGLEKAYQAIKDFCK
jgi:tetratricopeptide (TPR) repeat protein